MAGLLDFANSDEALLGLSLLAAGAPRAGGRTSIGEGLLGAVQMVNASRRQREEDAQRRAAQALQAQHMQGLLDAQREQSAERQRGRAQEEQDAGLLRQQFSPLAGPTQDEQPLMPRFDLRSMLAGGASPPSVMQAMQLNQAMNPKPEAVKLSAGEGMFDPRTGKQLFGMPDKPEKAPEALRTLAMIFGEGSPQYIKAAQQLAQKMTTHQPASSTNVTLGSPVPVTLPDGSQALVQPANRPGEPPQIMRIPGTETPLRPPPKDMPAGMAEKFAQNAVTLQKIDKALDLVKANPNALGAKNYAPDAVMQRLDPLGVETRALLADIAGQKIHDRSGAAVTVGEAERLKPYIPKSTDTPEAAAQRLELFRQEYAAMQQALATGASIKQAAAGGDLGGVRRISSDSEYNALPSGAEFIGPDGKRRRKP